MKKLLEHPWSGKNYSSKIWDTTGNFVNKMDSIVTTGLIQGKSYNVIAKELERAKVGKNGNGGLRYQCERLIRTEAAFITEQAAKDSYEKYGVEEYEYSATLDLRTSEICSELDNKVFKVSEAITGANYPPMHVNCRSTTVPVVRWEGEETEDDVRIYRDPITGKNNYAKVKDYAEWKDMQYEKYGESKVPAEQKKIRNKASDKLQYDRYKEVLDKNILPVSFTEFQEIKYNDTNEWNKLKSMYSLYNSNSFLQNRLDYILSSEKGFIPRKTVIKNVKIIAGNGSNTILRSADMLCDKYGGNPENWSKKVGKIESAKYIFDIHWNELDGRQFLVKVKMRKEKKV